jgi:hypothetical protein
MKIYGIFDGCEFEGGGVGDFFFTDKNKARFEAQFLIEEKNKELHPVNQFKKTSKDEWRAKSDLVTIIERTLKN